MKMSIMDLNQLPNKEMLASVINMIKGVSVCKPKHSPNKSYWHKADRTFKWIIFINTIISITNILALEKHSNGQNKFVTSCHQDDLDINVQAVLLLIIARFFLMWIMQLSEYCINKTSHSDVWNIYLYKHELLIMSCMCFGIDTIYLCIHISQAETHI